jgi:hypothetical protein
MINTTRQKALEMNKDVGFYGSFAEIGAGQEVARHFFQAGLASQTVAKSMSAYDKAFSDAIYGKGSRFVSEERLIKMLAHEFDLLKERLPERAEKTCFFSFANTVATSSHEEVPSCHGWMGIRLQRRPGGPTNDMIIHVRMLDRLRLQQQEALGILGVNLLYSAYKFIDGGGPELVSSLLENLSRDRIEVNFVRISGPDCEHIDNRLLSLELVRNDMTRAVLFSPKGETLSISDTLYKKSVVILRGTFRPVTNTNEKILTSGIKQAKKDLGIKDNNMIVLLELTMSGLRDLTQNSNEVDKKDFLDRVDTLCSMGHNVLISNFPLFAQLQVELRHFTEEYILMTIGATTLNALFDTKHYTKFPGGIMAAFGHLFDKNSRVYVYPYKSETSCITGQSFNPDPSLAHFYRHLVENRFVVDMENCDDVDTSLTSDAVRKLLSASNPKWEDLVPPSVRDLIKKRKLFGFTGR